MGKLHPELFCVLCQLGNELDDLSLVEQVCILFCDSCRAVGFPDVLEESDEVLQTERRVLQHSQELDFLESLLDGEMNSFEDIYLLDVFNLNLLENPFIELPRLDISFQQVIKPHDKRRFFDFSSVLLHLHKVMTERGEQRIQIINRVGFSHCIDVLNQTGYLMRLAERKRNVVQLYVQENSQVLFLLAFTADLKRIRRETCLVECSHKTEEFAAEGFLSSRIAEDLSDFEVKQIGGLLLIDCNQLVKIELFAHLKKIIREYLFG